MQKSSQLPWALILLAATLVVSACATTSGDAFRTVASAELGPAQADGTPPSEDQADQQGEDPALEEPEEPEEPGLTVRSDPSGARVFLNGVFVGTTPLTLTELTNGIYEVRLVKTGYRTQVARVSYRGGTSTLDADLEPITGFIHVLPVPATAQVTIDGNTVVDGFAEVLIGSHRVSVRQFGFDELQRTVTVLEDRVTTVAAELSPAAFAISDLRVNRAVFNPANPGVLGQVRIAFRVTTFGSGTVNVLDPEGTTIYSAMVGPFDTWDQTLTWDGRDESRRPVADGQYTVTVAGRARDDDSQVLLTGPQLTVDSSRIITMRSLWNGLSGTLFAPTAEVLPALSFSAGLLAAAHKGSLGGGDVGVRIPTTFGVRLGVGGNMEVSTLVSTVIWAADAESTPIPSATLALKWALLPRDPRRSLSAAAALRATYSDAPYTDSFTTFHGVGLSLPVSLHAGPLVFTAAPELMVSTARPYDGDAGGLVTWAYGRAGIILDRGSLVTAISTAVRTDAHPNLFSLAQDLSLKVGAELHWMLPGTPVSLSVIGAGEFSSTEVYFGSAGGGFSVLY